MHNEFAPLIDDETRRFIVSSLDSHNIVRTGRPDWYPVNFVLRGERGDVLGGLLGELWADWLHVTHLWVSETARCAGHGTRLLADAEAYARQRGAVGVALETFSFQARPYYERLGYHVCGEIENYPPGHSQYFMKKSLAETGSDEQQPR